MTEGTAASARRARRNVVLTAAIAGLGGLLFGYDTGVISAALLYIAPEFALSDGMKQIVVASLLLGAIAGSIGAGPVVDRIGRKVTLVLLSAVFTLGALLSAAAPNTEVLIGARVLLGLAIGGSSLVVPTYIAEIAPLRCAGDWCR